MISHPHFEEFVLQATGHEPDTGPGLGADELYGLYTSWCLLKGYEPKTPHALWQGLKPHRIRPGANDLVMKGPAATDYILFSSPDLV